MDVAGVQQRWVREHGSIEAAAAAWGSVDAVMGCWPRTIRSIRLAGCQALTDAGLTALRCPNLQSLDLEGCHGVTACGTGTLVMGCPLLAELNLSRCRCWPGAAASVAWIAKLRHLRALRIAHCRGVTDSSLRTIAAGCWRLQLLDVRGCTATTGNVARQVLADCPMLQQLKLGHRAMAALHEIAPALRSLPRGHRLMSLTMAGHVPYGMRPGMTQACPVVDVVYDKAFPA